ncbi:MAG: type II toxin-antitoxin system VapC family toxin [Gemmatimonadota bacterium]
MVYLDTSVVLAQLLAEDVRPPAALWDQPLVASRLTEYELITRLRALDLSGTEEALASFRAQVSLIDLSDALVRESFESLPKGLRTLDALHLASALFLRDQGVDVRIATYDGRLAAAASEMGFGLYPLDLPPG